MVRTVEINFSETDPEIPMEDLEVGATYVGTGRFINDIARWNGQLFVGLTFKFGSYSEATSLYGELGFSPIVKLQINRESNTTTI